MKERKQLERKRKRDAKTNRKTNKQTKEWGGRGGGSIDEGRTKKDQESKTCNMPQSVAV